MENKEFEDLRAIYLEFKMMNQHIMDNHTGMLSNPWSREECVMVISFYTDEWLKDTMKLVDCNKFNFGEAYKSALREIVSSRLIDKIILED